MLKTGPLRVLFLTSSSYRKVASGLAYMQAEFEHQLLGYRSRRDSMGSVFQH